MSIRPDTSPGNKTGVIELNFESESAAGGSPGIFRLPFEAYVLPPYRIEPGVVMLGGLWPIDYETISVRSVDDVACTIHSFSSDSQSTRVERLDETTLAIHHVLDSEADFESAEIANLAITVRYSAHGTSIDRIESVPVHISRQRAEDRN